MTSLKNYPLTTYVDELARSVPTLAILTAQGMGSGQRAEARRLGDGRHCGDPTERAGLRMLGVQDHALGLTPLGRDVVDLLDCSIVTRSALGLCRRTG